MHGRGFNDRLNILPICFGTKHILVHVLVGILICPNIEEQHDHWFPMRMKGFSKRPLFFWTCGTLRSLEQMQSKAQHIRQTLWNIHRAQFHSELSKSYLVEFYLTNSDKRELAWAKFFILFFKMRQPGNESGANGWQQFIFPLNH